MKRTLHRCHEGIPNRPRLREARRLMEGVAAGILSPQQTSHDRLRLIKCSARLCGKLLFQTDRMQRRCAVQATPTLTAERAGHVPMPPVFEVRRPALLRLDRPVEAVGSPTRGVRRSCRSIRQPFGGAHPRINRSPAANSSDRQVVHDLPKSGFAQPLQNVLDVGRIGPIPP